MLRIKGVHMKPLVARLDGNNLRAVADEQRANAKRLLCKMFDIAPGESNGTVERLVDYIIGAAMAEVVLMQADAIKQIPSTDNP